MIRLAFAIALLALVAPMARAQIVSAVDPSSLKKSRQTSAGLYVTSAEAHAALQADPGIVLLDVRSRAEFNFVGHPDPADANIPYRFFDGTNYRERGKSYGWRDNENFLRDVEAVMTRLGKGKDDPIFVICRSGQRSAASVNLLAAAGYSQVYNIIDGFEGSKVKATGHRTMEGWRHENLPWSYTVRPEQAYPPSG